MAHRNARLTPHGRLLLCERVEIGGWKLREAAAAAGVSRQTAGKWLARWRAEGAAGLLDRSSRPLRIALRVVGELWRRVVLLRLRKRRGPAWIAWRTDLAPATVSRALRRHRLQRLRDLEPREPVVRYCWPHAGDLLHLDTKRLGRIGTGGGKRFGGRQLKGRHRGIGWDYAHVAVDDATRLAYAEELPDERAETAAAFLERALAFFAAYGIEVERLLTDNGSCYRSHRLRRSGRAAWPEALAHPALPAADQRQGGGVREDRPERLGLQAALRLDRRTDRRPPGLPSLLQWLPTAWRPGRRHTAGQAQVNNLVMQNI